MATLTVKDMTMTTEKKLHQDGDDVREYTKAEYAQAATDLAAAKVLSDKKDKAAADKAAVLARLGISADEAKLLLS
jgi:hypothetical protein